MIYEGLLKPSPTIPLIHRPHLHLGHYRQVRQQLANSPDLVYRGGEIAFPGSPATSLDTALMIIDPEDDKNLHTQSGHIGFTTRCNNYIGRITQVRLPNRPFRKAASSAAACGGLVATLAGLFALPGGLLLTGAALYTMHQRTHALHVTMGPSENAAVIDILGSRYQLAAEHDYWMPLGYFGDNGFSHYAPTLDQLTLEPQDNATSL
ncbi:MAG: hypothetical protein ACOCWQ_05710 [Nanoarchaeota archaeon]